MIYQLRKFRKDIGRSRDAKVLTENFISLSVLKVLGYIFPLITLPYLARVIGVDKFGEIAFAAAIIIYFETFIDFGFNFTAVRDIAINRNDQEKVSKIFSTIMLTKILLALVSLILLLGLIWLVPLFRDNRLILLLTFLYLPGYILFPDWFFQAMENMKYITFINLISKLLFTVLVFVFIKEKSDYIFQPVLIALGYLVSGLISIFIILRKYRLKLVTPRLKEIIEVLRDSYDMFISLFVPNLYTNFSIIMLKSYTGLVPTGLYSGGFKFIDLISQLFAVLSRTFYPFLARRLDKHRLYVMITGILSVVASIALYAGADLLIKIFYTPDFAESAKVIKIMAVCPVFMFLMNTYGTNYLVLVRKENVMRNIILVCSLAGFALLWIAVPKYSYTGVAVTITFIWGIRGFLTRHYAVKHKNSVEAV
jgi:O-antigen/teichoic acid export membrane protein